MPAVPKVPRSTQEVLQSISVKADAVRDAAQQLSVRIQRFEEFIAKMPGRTEAHCFGEHPDSNPGNSIHLYLCISRRGKDWILQYGTWDDLDDANDPHYGCEVQPLTQAPLKIKMAAFQMFPKLLEAVENTQDELAASVLKATKEYDAWEKSLMARTEGK